MKVKIKNQLIETDEIQNFQIEEVRKAKNHIFYNLHIKSKYEYNTKIIKFYEDKEGAYEALNKLKNSKQLLQG